MGIIDGKASPWNDDVKREARVVYVCAILGFCASQALVGYPTRFDVHLFEKDGKPMDLKAATEERTKFDNGLKLIDDALRSYPALREIPTLVTGGDVPDRMGGEGVLSGGFIRGSPRGSTLEPGVLAKPSTSYRQDWIEGTGSHDVRYGPKDTTLYTGVGAYVGAIDDPVFHNMYAVPTQRLVFSRRRYYPTEGYGNRIGMLGPRDQGILKGGDTPLNMGSLGKGGMDLASLGDEGCGDPMYGYVHGMSWAVGKAVQVGPWCIPLERAVGQSTRKLASCFMCASYMASGGFPASSIHLDRAESWCPLPNAGAHDVSGEVAQMLNLRWALDCRNSIRLGAIILQRTPACSRDLKIYAAARDIEIILSSSRPEIGSAMLLDSVLLHENDKDKLQAVLNP